MLAAVVVLGAIGAGAETLTVTKDLTLMTNAVYDSVSVASNATLNLNGRKLAVGAISGGGTVMSAMIDESPCAYGYAVLDYVQSPADNSTSNVLVDTLYKPTCTDRVETKVAFASVSGTQGIFSSRKGSSSQTFTCLLTSSKIRFDRNAKYTHAVTGTVSANTDYEIIADFDALRYMVNGTAPLATSGGTGTFTAYTNILLFATGEATAFASSCKMYYFRVFDKDGNMKVNMVPASKGGTVGFYDTVRKLFLVPANGELTAGSDISYKMLSYVQTPVENATAKVGVNTGYTPHLTDRVETKIRPTESPSKNSFQGVFSARQTTATNTFTCVIGHDSDEKVVLRFDHHTTRPYVYHQTGGSNTKFAIDEDYEIVMDGDTLGFSVNGVESSNTMTAGPDDKSANPGMTLRLFCVATKGNGHDNFVNGCRMYYFRVTDTNGYVRLNLVPAQLPDGSQSGFYDTVHNAFLGHASFVAGDVLPADLTEADGTCCASFAAEPSEKYGSVGNLFNDNFIYRTDEDSRLCFRRSLPLRVDYDFGDGNAKAVNMYRIWGGYTGDRSPSAWEFYGSDSAYGSSDETGWTHLDVAVRGNNLPGVSSGNIANCCTRVFVNTTAYRYYRLKVTAGGNSSGDLDFTQLEYFNIAAAANPGELRIDVADGEAATNATVALGGNLKVVKDGEGSLLLSCVSNLFYTGGTDVEAGEFVVGAPLSTALIVADGATLGFNLSRADAVPLLTLESGSSIPSSLGVSIYREGRFSLPKAGATLTAGYDFSGTATTLLNPIAGVSRLRKDASGNLVVFGPSGLFIVVK